MTDPHPDEDDRSAAIEKAEAVRDVTTFTRQLYNGFLAEGFTEQQALLLARSWLTGLSGGLTT